MAVELCAGRGEEVEEGLGDRGRKSSRGATQRRRNKMGDGTGTRTEDLVRWPLVWTRRDARRVLGRRGTCHVQHPQHLQALTGRQQILVMAGLGRQREMHPALQTLSASSGTVFKVGLLLASLILCAMRALSMYIYGIHRERERERYIYLYIYISLSIYLSLYIYIYI